jgi:transcriptional regulator with XRE-family HTH domain
MDAMFVFELESERRKSGLTQDAMAKRLAMSPRTYRAYVTLERPLHPREQSRIAARLKSARLAAAAVAELDNLFSPALLDVDHHPAEQFLRALSELREAIAAIEQVEVVGRLTREQVEHALDQVWDLLHLIPVLGASWSKAYGVDLWAVRARNLEKLRARGYVREEGEAA